MMIMTVLVLTIQIRTSSIFSILIREQENLVNLWDEAQCEEDREIFVKECLESPEQTGEYMTGIREESDELCERAEARGRVWDVAHMTIKEIREAAAYLRRCCPGGWLFHSLPFGPGKQARSSRNM